MKVLLTNGSPHKEGCTYTALCEVSEALNENDLNGGGNSFLKPAAAVISATKNICMANFIRE